jgi:ribonuclease HI
MNPTVEIWTDGACSGNPGPGGWGIVLVSGSHRKEISGAEPRTTNNRMELIAALRALERLGQPSQVLLWTDSQYLQKGIEQWIHGWQRNGWLTASRQPVKNEDLWRALLEQSRRHEVRWKWVRGHSGHVENERCDRLAVAGARRAAKGERGELEGSPQLELPSEEGPPVAATVPGRGETLRASARAESGHRTAEGAFGPAARSGKGTAEGTKPPARGPAPSPPTRGPEGRLRSAEAPATPFEGPATGGPGRNLELKLRAGHDETRRRALAAGARPEALLDQVDEFFVAAAGGRLKLRSETRRNAGGETVIGQRSELIWYRRADEAAARTADYEILPVADAALAARLLESACGRCGRVSKLRELLRLGPARLHLDRVAGLGDFVELEWVLKPGEDPEAAQPALQRLLQVLGLDGAPVEARAYRDLLEEG